MDSTPGQGGGSSSYELSHAFVVAFVVIVSLWALRDYVTHELQRKQEMELEAYYVKAVGIFMTVLIIYTYAAFYTDINLGPDNVPDLPNPLPYWGEAHEKIEAQIIDRAGLRNDVTTKKLLNSAMYSLIAAIGFTSALIIIPRYFWAFVEEDVVRCVSRYPVYQYRDPKARNSPRPVPNLCSNFSTMTSRLGTSVHSN